jgi:hypothetical protein
MSGTPRPSYPWQEGDALFAAELNAAIEAAAVGTGDGGANLILPNLPTSSVGLAPGQIWNNGGYLCVA